MCYFNVRVSSSDMSDKNHHVPINIYAWQDRLSGAIFEPKLRLKLYISV